jgi:hypothetical protein
MTAKRPALKMKKRILNLALALLCVWLGSSSAWAQAKPAPTIQGRSSSALFFAETLFWKGSGQNGTYSGPVSGSEGYGKGATSLAGVLTNYLTSMYRLFRTFSIGWLTLYGLFLGVQFAFAGASEEEIRNYFVGSCVVVGANVLASLYSALFNFQTAIPKDSSVPIQTIVERPAYYCYVEKVQLGPGAG